jgi:hypothetical protein
MLEAGAKVPGTYMPGRRKGDHLQVITVINFKGGSGKTTTAAHLAQKCALDGYRVLAIDLDPQASLSALHGFQPEFDLLDGGTLYDAIRYEDPLPAARHHPPHLFHQPLHRAGQPRADGVRTRHPARPGRASRAICSSPGFRMPSPRSRPTTTLS